MPLVLTLLPLKSRIALSSGISCGLLCRVGKKPAVRRWISVRFLACSCCMASTSYSSSSSEIDSISCEILTLAVSRMGVDWTTLRLVLMRLTRCFEFRDWLCNSRKHTFPKWLGYLEKRHASPFAGHSFRCSWSHRPPQFLSLPGLRHSATCDWLVFAWNLLSEWGCCDCREFPGARGGRHEWTHWCLVVSLLSPFCLSRSSSPAIDFLGCIPLPYERVPCVNRVKSR